MRVLVLLAGSFIFAGTSGCHAITTGNAMDPAAECPAGFQDQVRIAASAVPWSIPGDFAQEGGVNAVVGRRVSVSISPQGEAYGLRIAYSELAISPYGGTFRGWAQLNNAAEQIRLPVPEHVNSAVGVRASGVEVTPGRVRVTPFLPTSTLRPQTLVLDLILTPGAEPLDEMVISAGALWDGGLHPVAPDRISLSFEPVRHYTVYDQVDGVVSGTFVVNSGSHTRTTCTAEGRVTLVDRSAATPPLWDLRESAPVGRSELWLALSDPQTGAHRVVFKSPAEAEGFANWLHQTHALRIGRYQLGVFRPGYSGEARRTVPRLHAVQDTFQAASVEDLDALVVGRLGET